MGACAFAASSHMPLPVPLPAWAVCGIVSSQLMREGPLLEDERASYPFKEKELIPTFELKAFSSSFMDRSVWRWGRAGL